MVFADPEYIEADLVREFDFFHQVCQSLLGADSHTSHGIRRRLGERINAKLHYFFTALYFLRISTTLSTGIASPVVRDP